MLRRATGVVTLGCLIALGAAPASAGGHKKKKPKPQPEQPAPAPDPAPVPEEEPPPPPPEPEPPAGPWAEGVTPEQKATAQSLLEAGNALFIDKKFVEALDQYRQAVQAWDHPAIRFNMVRALIQLDRPVEAYDNLELALKYDAAPLEENVYNEAKAYEKLLLGQIAQVEVSCKEPDAQVSLDGQPLLSCPGIERRRMAPGQHQVVARKEGYMTLTKDVVLLPGKDEAVAVELVKLEDAAVITHRWAQWKPWAVVGGGALVAGLGGLVQLKAVSDMKSYNDAVAQACSAGCPPGELSANQKSLESTAKLENKIAIGVISVGAATVVTGAVLVFMNRARTTYPDEHATQLAVTPLPGGGASVSLGLRF